MIFSSLYANNRSIVFPSAIEDALEYLKSHDFTTMEPGVYEIKGKDIYAQVFDTETKPLKNSVRKCMKNTSTFNSWLPGKKNSVLHRIPETMKWQNEMMNAI